MHTTPENSKKASGTLFTGFWHMTAIHWRAEKGWHGLGTSGELKINKQHCEPAWVCCKSYNSSWFIVNYLYISSYGYLCEQTRCLSHLIEAMQGDFCSLISQSSFIRQLITIYYILQTLHVLFARSMCLRTCRRARKGGGRHTKGREGTWTMGLRHHPKKAFLDAAISGAINLSLLQQCKSVKSMLPCHGRRGGHADMLHAHKSDHISQHNCLIGG